MIFATATQQTNIGAKLFEYGTALSVVTFSSPGDPLVQMLCQESDKYTFRIVLLDYYFPWIRVKIGAAVEADIFHGDQAGHHFSAMSGICL